ncbi:MAG: patatin-like phospholipase RssA [Gammaproteobacteria bacterium]
MKRRPRIGLALGSGSARGWSHIGVIRELESLGVVPDVIAGSSIGALVGGAYAAGKLDPLEEWLHTLTWRKVMSFMDVSLGGGLIAGEKLFEFFRDTLGDMCFEDCETGFVAVATGMETGREVWLREGNLFDAIRASIALPGLFRPYKVDGDWLLDGGLVNPVPVSVCRMLGADVVIAVDLNADLLEVPGTANKLVKRLEQFQGKELTNRFKERLGDLAGKVLPLGDQEQVVEDEEELPSLLEVLARSINIMSMRITRSRMAGDPPEVVIAPHARHIGLMEFHRVEEAIDIGRNEVRNEMQRIESIIDVVRNTTP